MKALIAVILIVLIGLGIWSYTQKPETPAQPVAPISGEPVTDGTYTVSTTSSSIAWEGSKVLIPGYTDRGTLKLSSGDLVVSGGNVISGRFVMDMNSISAGSTGRGDGESMLTNHLKSDDFFDVETYPSSTFVINDSVVGSDGVLSVNGDLTIKDKTVGVTIPASVVDVDGQLRIVGSVELDRTLWDIRYGSGKFFQDLGDNVIADTFKVTLDITATAMVVGTTTSATSTTN